MQETLHAPHVRHRCYQLDQRLNVRFRVQLASKDGDTVFDVPRLLLQFTDPPTIEVAAPFATVKGTVAENCVPVASEAVFPYHDVNAGPTCTVKSDA